MVISGSEEGGSYNNAAGRHRYHIEVIALDQGKAALPADIVSAGRRLLQRGRACCAVLVEHVIPYRPPVVGTDFGAILDGVFVLAEVAYAIEPAIFEVSVDGKRCRREVVDFVAGVVVGTGCEITYTMHLDGVVVAREATDNRVCVTVENRCRKFSVWLRGLQIRASWRCE